MFHVKHRKKYNTISQFLKSIMTDTQQFRFHSVLSEGALLYGIDLSGSTLDSFFAYYTMLSQYNTRTNLISNRDISRFVEYHLLDSLKVASVFDFSGVRNMMDFGSGAGLPGIPLSFAFPYITTTLIDSRSKRVDFLKDVITSFPALNSQVIKTGIHSLSDSLNGTFDVVITRATVKLKKFYCLSSRFLAPGGSLISIKGDSISVEISELKKTLNEQLFNLTIMPPAPVADVRNGTIVLIKRI